MTATKLYYMKFNTGEWLKDPKLRRCCPATKGIWIDLLSTMWEDDQSGVFVGFPSEMGRVCGCSPGEALAAAIELQRYGVADILPPLSASDLDSEITIVNRRMKKKKNVLSQKNDQNLTTDITITLSVDLSGSGSDPETVYEEFYARYPRKEGKDLGFRRLRSDIRTPEAYQRLVRSLDNYLLKIQSENIEPKFTLQFGTFMGRWQEFEHYQAPVAKVKDYSNYAGPRPAVTETKEVKL